MLKQVLEAWELLEGSDASGEMAARLLRQRGPATVEVTAVAGGEGRATEFLKAFFPGNRGRKAGGSAPTLGIIGCLGGVGARPAVSGMVSDADGALVALSVALKLSDLARRGEPLAGDVIVTTHVSPRSPVIPHEPVPFMGAPVSQEVMNRQQVDARMEAIVSVDATKGNRVINARGFAISPTIREGYILRASEDLLSLMANVTGRPPVVFAVTTQDLTPYGNGVYHLNAILQPSTATSAPLVAVAVTAETVIPGCASGANHPLSLEEAARFCLEVARAFGEGSCRFYDPEEFARLESLYGSLAHLKTLGGKSP